MFRRRQNFDSLPVRVIDGKGHVLGKLSAIIAKQLLIGKSRIVVVRAEEVIMSGHKHRNFVQFSSYLRKHVNTDHSKGPFHHRNPRSILRKSIRGMVPRRTSRGEAALQRLSVFEGVPRRFDKVRRHTVPFALRHLHAKNSRSTKISDISKRFGWKYSGVVSNLEQKRKLLAQSAIKRCLKSKSVLSEARANRRAELEAVESRMARFFEVAPVA